MAKHLGWVLFSFVFVLLSVSCSKGGGYVQKVLIQAPWGSGPGEFGLLREAEGIGPEALAVDGNKNLWIIDLVNSRVQEFNFGGKFVRSFTMPLRAMDLAIDEKNNLFLLAPYSGQIAVMSPTGNLVQRLSIPADLELVEGIRLEKAGLAVTTSDQKSALVVEKSDLANLKTSSRLSKRIVRQEEGLSSPFGTRRFRTQWKSKNTGVIEILDPEGKSVKTITVHPEAELGAIQFLSTDKEGNFYVLEELLPAPGQSLFKVVRFSRDGNQVASVEIPNKNIIDVHKPVFVDADGSVYFLNVQPDKFEVIKWEWE